MLGEERADAAGTVFRDAIMLMALGLILIIVILIQYFNPPTEETTDDPPGNLIFEIRWPDGMDVDIDLWVRAPKGPPVGYSNHGNAVLNLLRDDLGFRRDISSVNHEITFSRGRPPGEYIVNLHFYAARGLGTPKGIEVPVYLMIKMKARSDMPPVVIFEDIATLKAVGEEITAVRFSLDEEGAPIADSFGHRFMPMRSYQRGRP